MKRILCAALAVMLALPMTGCGKNTNGNESQTRPPATDPAEETSAAPETTGAPSETGPAEDETGPTEDETAFTAPAAQPVLNERHKGCFYGENTGTEQTYTGLEPLPLSDFGPPPFANENGLPDDTISHSFGVARDGEPHRISVERQAFFDEKGFNALCYDAKTQEKVLYLTFDCGYENGCTAGILDTLRDKNVKAAFFCTQPEMEGNPELIARMIAEGHSVGNHSVRHPDFSKLSRERMYEEVKGFDDYLRTHFGYSAAYFRYPQGKYSENSLELLNQMGYTCVFWSLAYEDWDLENQKGAEHALDTVISRLHPGAVILLHAVSPDNAAALGDIIDEARELGYEFRALYEYGT